MLNKINKVFIIITIFLAFSFLILLLTHQSLEVRKPFKESPKEININLIASKDYALYLKPILVSVMTDNSLENISLVRDTLFDYNEGYKSIGLAHVNLFLAFDTWQDYLVNNDNYLKENIIEKLNIVLNLIPELSIEIKQLKEILQ